MRARKACAWRRCEATAREIIITKALDESQVAGTWQRAFTRTKGVVGDGTALRNSPTMRSYDNGEPTGPAVGLSCITSFDCRCGRFIGRNWVML